MATASFSSRHISQTCTELTCGEAGYYIQELEQIIYSNGLEKSYMEHLVKKTSIPACEVFVDAEALLPSSWIKGNNTTDTLEFLGDDAQINAQARMEASVASIRGNKSASIACSEMGINLDQLTSVHVEAPSMLQLIKDGIGLTGISGEERARQARRNLQGMVNIGKSMQKFSNSSGISALTVV